MPAAKSTLVRRALAAALVGKTLAADRVFANRARQLWDGLLPAINVSLDGDAVEEETNTSYRVTATLSVQIAVKASDFAVDDDPDAVAERVDDEVRAAILGSTLGGLLQFQLVMGGAKLAMDGDGDSKAVVLVRQWFGVWLVDRVTPPDALPEYLGANVNVDPIDPIYNRQTHPQGGPDGTIDLRARFDAR